MLKKDLSAFEARLAQGQEAQQSQLYSPRMPGLFPLSYTCALQHHRGISFQTSSRCLLPCHMSGLWIHSPHSSSWSGRITSAPKQGIWGFWKPLRNFSVQATPRSAAHRAGRELCSPPTPRASGMFCCLELERSPTLNPCPWNVEL